MTKTIEFVEQNIFECKNHIQYLNNKINEDKKYPSLVKAHKERIRELKPIIQILEQIKCELEAWEICKNKLNLKVQTEEAVTEGFCMKGYWLLVEQYPYTQTTIIEQEEYEILKKSLEIEDE